jgi:hypothetical protein
MKLVHEKKWEGNFVAPKEERKIGHGERYDSMMK